MTNRRLVMIPDYLSSCQPLEKLAGADLLGLAEKVPPEIRTGRFFDAGNPDRRMALMMELDQVDALSVLTPGMGYYRRVVELRDDCFFADVTLRALEAGADVCVETGLREGHLLPRAREWIEELRRWGMRFTFRQELHAGGAARDLVTAEDVLRCHRQGKQVLITTADAIVTPYAWDEARERNITICKQV